MFGGVLTRLFLGLFLFFFSTVLFSRDFLVHTYSEADGLPGVPIYDIAQDPWGRMWFATRGGIAVYNGVSWKTYSLDHGLPVLAFLYINIDQKGRVWALSDAHPVFVLVYHDIYSESSENKEKQWKTINIEKH